MDPEKLEKTRFRNRLPVAREGLPFIFIGCALTFLLIYVGFQIVAVFAGILSLLTIYFFRDPERARNCDDRTVLTPADGKIIGVKKLDDEKNLLGGPAVKISVFMTILNVHVNRVPISGRVSKIDYRSGSFFSANLDKASERNESNRITLETENGHRIVVVQIAGLIARRIVCWVREGDRLKTGQRFGLIRFGSRLDIYLPIDSQICAQVNQKVKAGETILGYIS
jgi:phosphatidylserine decarboxylase